MIQVVNLTKYFGAILAVDNITFQVDKGEIVGFLGLNGAGKTTTMRILTGFVPATSGVARVAGFDVMKESMDVRRNIGYLPESVPLYPEMRVEEYVEYRAKIKGVPRAARRARLDYCLDRCRIREVRRRLIGTLSKGYRQRVGLADSMVHDPPILILDEPTVGLDPVQITETLGLIKDLGQSHTILLSTHILDQVEDTCGRVIIIRKGQIGLAKKMDELEKDTVVVAEVRGPAEQVTRELRSLEGVARVTHRPLGDGVTGFEVKAHGHKDLREPIGARVRSHNWELRRLDLRRRRLLDIFLEVVDEDEREPRRPAPREAAVKV